MQKMDYWQQKWGIPHGLGSNNGKSKTAMRVFVRRAMMPTEFGFQ
jgi:hypothetical protein